MFYAPGRGRRDPQLPDFTEQDVGNEIYGFRIHLTAADLEYMRNEIYARHGLRSKDSKWSSVFKSFKWYKATSANVDAKLTPVEKKNLQLIRQVEKELKENPEKFRNEEARYLEMAGQSLFIPFHHIFRSGYFQRSAFICRS